MGKKKKKWMRICDQILILFEFIDLFSESTDPIH